MMMWWLIFSFMLIQRSFQFSIQCGQMIWQKSSIHHRRLHNPISRCFHTISWALPQFNIGDIVTVNGADGTNQSGQVQDKKSGWYTIKLDKDDTVVKRRGSQMEYNSDTIKTTSSTLKSNGPPKETPIPYILDLDSILKSIEQTSQDDVVISNIIHDTSPNATITKETIQQITNCHSHYTKWLIFSDLHVMPTTLSTCLQVLDTIHAAAKERRAGILFLGDFWHHRGFVRVDCLNAVLDAMSKWSVPSIMIPGNHDQIDYRGVEHALTPFSNAYRIRSPMSHNNELDQQQYYPGPIILSHPTKFMNAFFIPHIRDNAMMKSILSSQYAARSSALFVHADVKGASMNDLIKSRNGLSTSIFPSDKQVYSGHFHKPHIVTASGGSTIRYVGSPYQISSSEEGQSKSLLLVDSQRCWECIEEIPLDVGPSFYRMSSISEFLGRSEDSNNLRRGDKVIVAVSQTDIDAYDNSVDDTGKTSNTNPFNERVKAYRKSGISVEIRDSPTISAKTADVTNENENNIEVDLEELSASATLAAYLKKEVSDGTIDNSTSKEIFMRGENILQELSDITSNSTAPMKYAPNDGQLTNLDFETISISGFGLFREECTYPLWKRGVVLIRGRNDDFGSDSNGVGKSTIAMASLWALSGSLDSRPVQDGKVGDVVNDLSKVAEVTLRGTLNSKPFVVKRTKGRSSAGSLSFILDGIDLTRQSSTETQKLMNEHFCSDSQILTRTIFHGQHSIGGLLEASDAKLKDELSQLVSLEIWQQSASLARSKQRELMRRVTEIEGMINLRTNDEEAAHQKTAMAKMDQERRQAVLDKALSSFAGQEDMHSSLNATLIEEEIDMLESQMRQLDAELSNLDKELSGIMKIHNNEVDKLRISLSEKVSIENEARTNMVRYQRGFDMVQIELQNAERNLLQVQSEWEGILKQQKVFQDATCHTCGQPISSVESRERVERTYDEKVRTALSARDEAEAAVSRASSERDQAQAIVDKATWQLSEWRENISQAEEKFAAESNNVRQRIEEIRSIQSKRSIHFASLAKRSKQIADFDLERAKFDGDLRRLTDAFDASKIVYDRCCEDLEQVRRNIADLEKERELRSKDATSTARLVNMLGTKGVQAFVLQNIVDALQICSRPYLDELSDGSLQLHIKVGSNDSIIKQAATRNPDGTWSIRPLASLSGGQWRRVSLSLSLGFAQLSSKRGNLRSSLLVMDEPLAHLDSTGRANVGKLLRKICNDDTLALSTILVILQDIAAEEIEECFDQVDEVVKAGGKSYIILDSNVEDISID